MCDNKKNPREQIVKIRWERKTPAYIRTTLKYEYARYASEEDRLEICMIAQHVTWLQKEFDDLTVKHKLLQQRFDEMNQKDEHVMDGSRYARINYKFPTLYR